MVQKVEIIGNQSPYPSPGTLSRNRDPARELVPQQYILDIASLKVN